METKVQGVDHNAEPMNIDGQEQGSAGAQTVWDEERIEGANKVLKNMYIKLRELRTTIPRLVEPLTTKQSSPEALFHQLSNAATTSNREVKQFRQLVEDEESRKIFEHVKESRAQNPKGISPWRITQDPDWLKKDS